MKLLERSNQPNVSLAQLTEALRGAEQVLILPHNNPDPDAIASALALRVLLANHCGLTARIVYGGIIGRAENRALVDYLDHPLERLTTKDLQRASHLLLVDTQPRAGNSPLPADMAPTIVLDHHPLRTAPDQVHYADIRPKVGATASILVEYLQAAGVQIESRLATALFYGIKTDTQGLERGTSRCDHAAFTHLAPRVDLEALFKIEHAPMPGDYFSTLAMALQSARCYDAVVVSYLGAMSYPDMAANIADLLLRRQGSHWVICAGIYKQHLYLSVRTCYKQGASQLVQKVVGALGSAGGHGSMAGAQIPLKDKQAQPESLLNELCRGFLLGLDLSPDLQGRPLV